MTAAVFLAALAIAGDARADDGAASIGSRARARVRPFELALTPALGASIVAVGLAIPGTTDPPWIGRNAFDDAVRDLVLPGGKPARDTARMTSDGSWMVLAAYPLVVESLVLAGVVHHRWDVALRLTVTYGEAAFTAGLLTLLSQGVVARGRPLLDECARDPGYERMCGTRQHSKSFFAGHPAAAFNAASMVCQTTNDFTLYGSRSGGIAACLVMMSFAGTTGVLRLVADKHWATDVIAGAGVGAATGMLAPFIVRRVNGGEDPPRITFVPMLTPTFRGASAGVTF